MKSLTKSLAGIAIFSMLITTGMANNKFSRKTMKAKTNLTMDVSRTVLINEVVRSSNTKKQASQIRKLMRESKKPIYLYLDSPGGSVVAGLFLIHEIEKAKAQGVKFVCVVDKMAASMAFQFLLHCDMRYAHKTSSMLWHPVRINVRQASITPDVAKQLFLDLRYTENAMLPKLISTLGLSKEVFYYHYNAETLHFGEQLGRIAPKFLKLINGISNYNEVLDAIEEKKKNTKVNIFEILFGKVTNNYSVLSDYVVDYTYPEFVKTINQRNK